jgi:hypothetical protein
VKTLLIILLVLPPVFAASVNGAYVEASIDPVPGSPNFLIYNYRIVNGGSSRDAVKTFTIDVRNRTSGVTSNAVSTPSNWTFMGIRNEELTWAANDKGAGVGQSTGFLKIKSDGLPGIRQYRLAPSLENSKIPFGPPQDGNDLKNYLRKVEEFKRTIEARGITLAPVAPPTPFVPLAFVDILMQNFDECVSQGMIKNKGVSDEIVKKFRVIRTSLENNNAAGARSLSQNLIEQMGFQKESKLPLEISALIKHNLQYLVTQLSKK